MSEKHDALEREGAQRLEWAERYAKEATDLRRRLDKAEAALRLIANDKEFTHWPNGEFSRKVWYVEEAKRYFDGVTETSLTVPVSEEFPVPAGSDLEQLFKDDPDVNWIEGDNGARSISLTRPFKQSEATKKAIEIYRRHNPETGVNKPSAPMRGLVKKEPIDI